MKLYVIGWMITFYLLPGWSNESVPLNHVKQWVLQGDLDKALEALSQSRYTDLSPQGQNYALGRLSWELDLLPKSKKYFKEISLSKNIYKDWADFYLGSIARKESREKTAKGKFLKLAHRRQPIRLRQDARYELALTAIQDKKWREARRHLYYLERRLRGSAKYSEVLWKLIGVEKKSKRLWRACRWARKLYSRYPALPLLAEWNIDLKSNLYEGKKTGCLPTPEDQKRRIERLQWAGETDRARREIEWLRERAKKGAAKIFTDLLLANFQLRQGFVPEAMQTLLPHYERQKNSTAYLNLLAKAAQYQGKYQSAVGIYKTIYKRSPRSRAGRKALFKAAFTSYQFKDYDGAERIFSQFIKKNRRSGLTRDARWHLAWMDYLRGHYKKASYGFQDILKRKKRRRRYWRSFSEDRVLYWLGRSFEKMEQKEEAKEVYEKLLRSHRGSYYAILASQKVSPQELNKLRRLASVSLQASEVDSPSEKTQDDEGGESEETLARQDGAEESSEKEEEVEESWKSVNFDNHKMSDHFARAQNLIQLGFYDDALWELYKIERRAKKTEHLKALMHYYQEIEAFHRSAYIGHHRFVKQRKTYGIEGVRYLWEYSYLQAFLLSVQSVEKEFGVPKPLVWSIMKAESGFKKDAVSVVGARGLMQLMPYTARRVAHLVKENLQSEKQLENPRVNIRYGGRYLARLIKKFDLAVPLVAASYNAGPHRVDKWLHRNGHLHMDEFIEHIPFVETRNYVKKVTKNFSIYSDLYDKKASKSLLDLTKKLKAQPSTLEFHREDWSSIN